MSVIAHGANLMRTLRFTCCAACLVASVFLLAILPGARAANQERQNPGEILLSGSWQISGQGMGNAITFARDGSFTTENMLDKPGSWRIYGKLLLLGFGDGQKDTFPLPLNPKGTPGTDDHGNAITAAMLGATAGGTAPAPLPTPATSLPPLALMSGKENATTVALLISAPWKVSENGGSRIRIFDKDGTFTTKNRPAEHGTWEISGNAVTFTFEADGHKDTLMLPLDPNGTAGTSQNGRPISAVQLATAAPDTAAAPGATPAVSEPAQPGDATVAMLVSGPWRLSTKAGSDVRVFKQDGTFSTVDKADENGRWAMTKEFITMTFPNGHAEALTLPLNPKGTEGLADDGSAMTAMLVDT